MTETGSKSWLLRITVDGRRWEIGLGGWPEVSLADARRKALEHRAAVADGRDPLSEKRRAAVPTFREAAKPVYDANGRDGVASLTPPAGGSRWRTMSSR